MNIGNGATPGAQGLGLAGSGQALTLVTSKTAQVSVSAKAVQKKSLQGDWLKDTAVVVENMNQMECLQQLPILSGDSDRAWFTIGGILSRIRDQQWWTVDGCASFNTFVEDKVGIPSARANSWIRIYNSMLAMGITIDELDGVGWTKLKDMIGYMTKANKDEMINLAKNMTVSQLALYLKGLGTGDGKKKKVQSGQDSTTVFKVRLHEDQSEVVLSAIERASKQVQTEYDAVALTSICEQYMGLAEASQGGHVSRSAMVLSIQEMGAEGLATMLEEAFPHLNISITEEQAFDHTNLGAL